MSKKEWIEQVKIEQDYMYKLVEENAGDLIQAKDDVTRRTSITRLRNSLLRNGYRTRLDICEANYEDMKKQHGLGGSLAKTVIHNIKGDYDERKAKEERLDEIDKAIERLLNEKVMILKSLD